MFQVLWHFKADKVVTDSSVINFAVKKLYFMVKPHNFIVIFMVKFHNFMKLESCEGYVVF